MTVIIIHPHFGRGTVEEMTLNLDGDVLAFIRWTTSKSRSIAGGWYRIDDWDAGSLAVGNAAEFVRMYRQAKTRT